jgi:hypothetical protein
MPVIPVNKVVDPKRIIGKNGGQGGGEAQGVADPKNINPNIWATYVLFKTPPPKNYCLIQGQKIAQSVVPTSRVKLKKMKYLRLIFM